MPTKEWDEAFVSALRAEDISTAIGQLDVLSTAHAGTPPQAIKRRAIRLIECWFDDETIQHLAYQFCDSGNDGAKEIGITLAARFFAQDHVVVCGYFSAIGDDSNWEVREWTASSLGTIIAQDFKIALPYLGQWVGSGRPNLRRLAVVAIGYATKTVDDHQAGTLLRVLEPLLADDDVYVRKNLGPFALGSYAIGYKTDVLRAWVDSIDLSIERVAWNLAMIFSTSTGRKRATQFESLLTRLQTDERPTVRRAVSRVMKNIQPTNGEIT